MRLMTIAVLVAALAGPASACRSQPATPAAAEAVQESSGRAADAVRITRGGSRRPVQAPAEHFTGTVRIERLIDAPESARVVAASVAFEPGARTHWHSHPLGQTLIVTSGVGLVQQEGGPAQEIRAGDVVWTPPGVKHWHGATPTAAHEPHRGRREARRQERRVDGTRHR